MISFVVDVPGADWVRLRFDRLQLAGDVWAGTGSQLRLTSLQDGALQTLNSNTARQWHNTSAYFNGSAVLVEVLVVSTAWRYSSVSSTRLRQELKAV